MRRVIYRTHDTATVTRFDTRFHVIILDTPLHLHNDMALSLLYCPQYDPIQEG